MIWEALADDPDRRALAQSLVTLTATDGWTVATMASAADATFGDPSAWRRIFPRGPRAAIWHISAVSDASMKLAFADRPADEMAQVIATRFEQNADLKPFVRRVMAYDLLHPLQALARMQRTAQAMFDCLGGGRRHRFSQLMALNLAYTVVVFIWLIDSTPDGAGTRRATHRAMRMIGLTRRS